MLRRWYIEQYLKNKQYLNGNILDQPGSIIVNPWNLWYRVWNHDNSVEHKSKQINKLGSNQANIEG